MFPGFVLLAALILLLDDRTSVLVPFTSIYMVLIFLASRKVDARRVWALAALCLVGALAADVHNMVQHQLQSGLVVGWRVLINATSFFGTALLSISLNRAHLRLTEQSEKDFLTQISNRRSFTRELEREVRTHCRRQQPFAIAFFDVDDFKVINDTLGHKRGDRVLIRLAAALAGNIRSMDRVCRYGGDEFVLFLGDTDADRAQLTIQRLRQQVYREVEGTYSRISLSTGVVVFDLKESISAEELIAQADREMYTIKKRAKNGISVVRFAATGQPLAQQSA